MTTTLRARTLHLERGQEIEVPNDDGTSKVEAPDGTLCVSLRGEHFAVRHVAHTEPQDAALMAYIDSLPDDGDYEVTASGNGGFTAVKVHAHGLRLHDESAAA